MTDPARILHRALACASVNLSRPLVKNKEIRSRAEYVCRCLRNRAGVRLLMACLLAKIDRPQVDPRKPYTEIGSSDCFSGRSYDESYITHFINENRLPCNPTTAFLTPALRNIDRPLTAKVEIIGRPRQLYTDALQLLDDVHTRKVSADNLLAEVLRLLLLMRDEKDNRMATLLAGLRHSGDITPLSTEAIVTLIEQHLKAKNSSRLPVLVVATAYQVMGDKIGERVLPLKGHNAADEQTGAIGDVEICLVDEDQVVTAYEMKMKRVTIDDVDRALQKMASIDTHLDNYIFITTDEVDVQIQRYAKDAYERTAGTEIAILDCIGFLRHFLHLFHRLRIDYLDTYQALVLAEPESAVSQPLKEAFLALRQAAEADA
ncbi:MAG: restriction endonuclease, SacI family [Chloroflexi bacterium]|nr:restriction endonuclease, SacI family [Chloroflexota bacterium]